VLVDEVDYRSATARVLDAARHNRPYGVTALAVHGVMTAAFDRSHRYRINHLDMVTPDGQPVRWALNLLHGTRLPDRVYGPTLTLDVLAAAADEGLPVYFYGSRREVLDALVAEVGRRFPNLVVAGAEPSKFRSLDAEEKREVMAQIRASGAKITLVGLGCPRQEVFAYESSRALGMPVLAVGAAFDYHSGFVSEPPSWVQSVGLQWLARLLQEPRRLWRRYLLLNPAYLALLACQALHLWKPDVAGSPPNVELRPG
jgi:exopolysaccharide biosynthesis WecB/TagA/CpsF family protein